MNTQQLIDQARTEKKFLSSYGEKSDWQQFAGPVNGIEVELRLKDVIVDGKVSQKIIRTTFFKGSLRISRKEAETILAKTIA